MPKKLEGERAWRETNMIDGVAIVFVDVTGREEALAAVGEYRPEVVLLKYRPAGDGWL